MVQYVFSNGCPGRAQLFQDDAFRLKRQAEEAQYARQKEQEQLQGLSRTASQEAAAQRKEPEKPEKPETHPMDRDFEGGYGGQEDMEDRYATTSGEH
ncbi:hypothetical protein EWM64_g9154 [Hericium alpestre]|uniref:Uncharacterized protein n=1 Tax=Hericium alpestre TaxID=135208 RepID=A0A4Y9ZKV9_9AGAM|nr:hypothetical protein EWM64_g9154 [Hericium alpestre]